MGKSGRSRKRKQGKPAAKKKRSSRRSTEARSPDDAANAALRALLLTNEPERLSLAGAYALGLGTLALAQQEDAPLGWLAETDALDVLFLGTAFLGSFRDAHEFGNARTAWFRLLRDTSHWRDVKAFVAEVMSVSDELDLPIDDATVLLRSITRLAGLGLDRRKLPRALLPRHALKGARFLADLGADLDLSEQPSRDACGKAQRLVAEFDAGEAPVGSCAEALSVGLSLFHNAQFPVRDDAGLLLVALYAALVASDDEPLDDLAVRAFAWAAGLDGRSPLVPIVDTMVAAAHQGLSPETAVSRLFILTAFTDTVPATDTRWHSGPGTDLVPLALEFGHPRVITSIGETRHLSSVAQATIESQDRSFRKRFGRPPGPDDPLYTDPDQDAPGPVPVETLRRSQLSYLQRAGLHPAWIHAMDQLDGLLPMPDGTFHRRKDEQEWWRAVEDYVRSHPDDVPDDDVELAKLQAANAVLTMRLADDDPVFAAQLVELLDGADDGEDPGLDSMRDFLEGTEPRLLSAFEGDAILHALAIDTAEEWSGDGLAQRVRRRLDASLDGEMPVDHAVVLVLAIVFAGAEADD